MFEKISQFLVPIAGRLNNNRYLQVLRDAFMLAFPLTIFGSIFVVLTNLPFLNKIMNASMLTSFQSFRHCLHGDNGHYVCLCCVRDRLLPVKKLSGRSCIWRSDRFGFLFALNAIYHSARNRRCHYRGYPGRSSRCKRDVSWDDYGISFW